MGKTCGDGRGKRASGEDWIDALLGLGAAEEWLRADAGVTVRGTCTEVLTYFGCAEREGCVVAFAILGSPLWKLGEEVEDAMFLTPEANSVAG